MPNRDWLNPDEEPIQTQDISLDSIHAIMPTPDQVRRDALLSVADLADTLEFGQFMVVQRHNPNDTPYGSMFTVKIYKPIEDKL